VSIHVRLKGQRVKALHGQDVAILQLQPPPPVVDLTQIFSCFALVSDLSLSHVTSPEI
jgi:hypothetical protein